VRRKGVPPSQQAWKQEMKGIVFTEFVSMVETVFSPEIMDRVFDRVDLPSGGAYTAVGTYDHTEIVQLATALGEETNTPVADLVRAYGEHLFGRFTVMYPEYFEDQQGTFEFLHHVENYIHSEVLKLYPDAEVPRFEFQSSSENELVFDYLSSRHLGDVAEGLLRGCIAHFKEPIDIVSEDLSTPELACIRFTLQRMVASAAA